jgi:lysophospholipase L1-like esterase
MPPPFVIQPSYRPVFQSSRYVLGAGGLSKITSLASVGDSTTANAGNAGIDPDNNGTNSSLDVAWANAVYWYLEQDLTNVNDTTGTPLVSFARSGVKSDHVLATQIPAILAEASQPSHVLWKIGTNDVSQNYPIATSEANIRQGIADLKAAGIESIITTINPRREGSGKESDVEAFNNLLQTIASETGSQFVDLRPILEDGVTPGREKLGVLYDGVHQWQTTDYLMGQFTASAIASRVDSTSVFDRGTLLHDQADIASTPPGNVTTSESTVPRDDGVPGNWERYSIEDSPSVEIGTGNSGVSYSPIGPVTKEDVHIYHRVAQFNSNYTGDNPTILVSTDDAGKNYIEVRSDTTGITATTTAGDVVSAINAHPEASLLVTASNVGDGSGLMIQGDSWEAWSLIVSNADTDPTDGDWVRAIAEVYPRGPIRRLFLRLWRSTPFSATLRSVNASSTAGAAMIPGEKVTLATPWYQVQAGDSGWRAQLQFGGNVADYDVGRFGVQKLNS